MSYILFGHTGLREGEGEVEGARRTDDRIIMG